ncbi:hypothetical protein BC628DRAFT_1311639 [Trametes gibbosa]|nr:hypothetical protein BC628DRAFT_1311639 [Trametes gibbosa]
MHASRASHQRGHSPAQSIPSSSGRRPTYIASGARGREEDRERGRGDDRGRYRDDERRSKDRDTRRDDERYRDDGRRRDSERRRGDKSRERRSRSSSRARRHSSSSRRPRSSSRDRKHHTSEPPPKELTAEEQRKLWLRRIELLQKVIQARTDHVRLHDELQKLERLAKSVQYESLPEEDKTALQNLIATSSTRVREKERELNAHAGKLIPDDFWPFAQRAEQTSDPGYQRMTEVLASLKGDVDELHSAINNMQSSQPSAAAPASAPAAEAKSESGELGNDVSATGRPKKRRRLSNDDGPPATDLSSAELEKMQDALAVLTHRISDLQNNMLQYDSHIADEVEAQLDYKMSTLRLVNGEIEKPGAPELQEIVQKLVDGLEEANKLADASAQRLAELQSMGKELDEQRELMRRQNDAMHKQIEELEAEFETTTKHKEEIVALREAITSITARVADPPPPPAPLSAEAIVEAIRPQLVHAAREDLFPILNDVRAHIQKELHEQSSQVSGELMTQMVPVVRSVERISAWIERIRGPNGAPVMVTPGAAAMARSASASSVTAASSASTTPAPVDKGKGKGVART